jgi:hypothetical protein
MRINPRRVPKAESEIRPHMEMYLGTPGFKTSDAAWKFCKERLSTSYSYWSYGSITVVFRKMIKELIDQKKAEKLSHGKYMVKDNP